MATITLPDLSALDGKKTYITLVVGMLAIAANHFGVLPYDIGLDPSKWLQDEYQAVVGMVFRSAIAKTPQTAS